MWFYFIFCRSTQCTWFRSNDERSENWEKQFSSKCQPRFSQNLQKRTCWSSSVRLSLPPQCHCALPERLRLAACHIIRPAQVLMGALIIKWPQWEHSEDAICRVGEKRGDKRRCSSRERKTTVRVFPLTRPTVQVSNRGCINISPDITPGPREAGKRPLSYRSSLTPECCIGCRGNVGMTERLFVQVLGSACLTPGPPGADITPRLPPSLSPKLPPFPLQCCRNRRPEQRTFP